MLAVGKDAGQGASVPSRESSEGVQQPPSAFRQPREQGCVDQAGQLPPRVDSLGSEGPRQTIAPSLAQLWDSCDQRDPTHSLGPSLFRNWRWTNRTPALRALPPPEPLDSLLQENHTQRSHQPSLEGTLSTHTAIGVLAGEEGPLPASDHLPRDPREPGEAVVSTPV